MSFGGRPGGVSPWPSARIRPPKESRICGEGGICGEVSRVEVGRLRRMLRNAVRARRGGGYTYIHIYIYIYIYRERERDRCIYIYIYIYKYML